MVRQHLDHPDREVERVIGVGEVSRRLRQIEDLRRRLARRPAHEERDVVLVRVRADVDGIAAAAQRFGHAQREVALPAGVVDVVVMEMDRAVFVWRRAPVHLGAGPVIAGHSARRQVHRLAVQRVARDVDHALGRDRLRKIPGADQASPQALRQRALMQRQRLVERQGATRQARAVDAAVVMRLGPAPTAGLGAGEAGGHQQRRFGRGRSEGDRALRARRRLEARVRNLPALVHADQASREVVARADEAPDALEQRLAGAHGRDAAVAVAQAQRRPAAGIDDQLETGAALGRPAGQQHLLAQPRRGRPDHRLHGEPVPPGELRRRRHEHVRAVVDRLMAALVRAVDRAVDGWELYARAIRVEVAAHHAHELRAIRPRLLAAHHEPDRLAGLHADLVAVAGDALDHAVSLAGSGRTLERRCGWSARLGALTPGRGRCTSSSAGGRRSARRPRAR